MVFLISACNIKTSIFETPGSRLSLTRYRSSKPAINRRNYMVNDCSYRKNTNIYAIFYHASEWLFHFLPYQTNRDNALKKIQKMKENINYGHFLARHTNYRRHYHHNWKFWLIRKSNYKLLLYLPYLIWNSELTQILVSVLRHIINLQYHRWLGY
jgi:hypothetical protein